MGQMAKTFNISVEFLSIFMSRSWGPELSTIEYFNVGWIEKLKLSSNGLAFRVYNIIILI